MIGDIQTLCTGCHGCQNICPAGAINMKKDGKGFPYPVVDDKNCIKCGLCRTVCPVLHRTENRGEPEAFACFAKDDKVRGSGSSGGIFRLLARRVISGGGVVFGAAFDETWQVRHIGVSRIEELGRLCGAKYVQSTVGTVFCDVRHLLEEGKRVYFSGTPCQIDGLKNFLKKEYENLICQDVICHGVGAPGVWEKYLNERSGGSKENICNINFRDKQTGWRKYQMKIEFPDGNYRCAHQTDSFMKLYLNNVILRPSCYACKSKSVCRNSDITLADFWGIDRIMQEMNDNKGTSLVLLNSEKGKKLFYDICGDMIWRKAPLKQALCINRNAYHSVSCPSHAVRFWKELPKRDMETLAKKYGEVSVPYLIKEKLSSALARRKQLF